MSSVQKKPAIYFGYVDKVSEYFYIPAVGFNWYSFTMFLCAVEISLFNNHSHNFLSEKGFEILHWGYIIYQWVTELS